MRLIQFFLVPTILFLVFIYYRRFRSLLLDRLIVLLIGMTGIVMILKPEWAGKLANDLGVGRGADLTMYVGLVGFGFVCLLLWSKMRDLEAKLTGLVRAQAIKDACGSSQS